MNLSIFPSSSSFLASRRIFADIQESIQGPDQGYINLHFRGLDIKNVEPGLFGLGRSDPFFEISKKNSDHASGVVRWYAIHAHEC